MNQSGRIKLMSRSLTSNELFDLHKWFHEQAIKRSKKERINDVVSLGIGGRVVYMASNIKFNVTGKIGTIKKIHKRRNEYFLTVEFDSDVYAKKSNRYSKEFFTWKANLDKDEYQKIMECLKKKYIENGGKEYNWFRNHFNYLGKYYTEVTGKKYIEEYTWHSKTLCRIDPTVLKPATKENIEMARLTRDQLPMINALNKAIKKVF